MSFYRVRDGDVVSEIIDGEAIIMDLSTGIYFSALGVGAVIWDGIAGGYELAEIKNRVASCFAGTNAALDADVEAFIAAALANNLVRLDPAGPQSPGRWSLELADGARDYAAPVLHRYGDMEDLALLDPIHDVAEETGWPAAKAFDWPSPDSPG